MQNRRARLYGQKLCPDGEEFYVQLIQKHTGYLFKTNTYVAHFLFSFFLQQEKTGLGPPAQWSRLYLAEFSKQKSAQRRYPS